MIKKLAFPICFALLRVGVPVVQVNTFTTAVAEVW